MIPNAYFFSFKWFLIYLITTPDIFLNQTHFVRLGIFHLELVGKKHTFWLWEWGRISAPNFGDREPCIRSLSITLIFITGHVEPGKTSFEVCMLFCFNICRSITFIMYNFSLGFSMYIFILQAHDDVILKQFIDLETFHYFGCYTLQL